MFIVMIDEKMHINIIFKALLSGVIITAMEFVLGFFYTFVLNDPIWTYGTADFMGIISFTWSLLWCALALCVLIAKRLIYKFTHKTK